MKSGCRRLLAETPAIVARPASDLRPTRVARSRRQAALEFIRRHFRDRGGSPSLSEISAAIGSSVASVVEILRDLEDDGEIIRRPGVARGIRLPDAVDELSDSEIDLALQRRGFIKFPIDPNEIGTAPDLRAALVAIIERAGDRQDADRGERPDAAEPS